ncbi:cobalt-precorrin 5A hydrolase [Kineothrix sp. MB12-C1]|uniref:cobalt-precorrin 5A hydrolase n=1 Tax=Kineothrix sp. MB12-C1 TaxID=3070215 RepID=UPI0027D2B443|nr:cobalt-precorrin 5A hydrolase [Kineothrix sp. MB12-C1]WMC93302.1 cobalt-precorrin 5A hydrolase [Kineothrix sp. MB12-C1]
MERRKINIISFTGQGLELSKELKKSMEKGGKEESFLTSLYTKWSGYQGEARDVKACKESLSEWAEHCFSQKHPVIFIGACAIAVRTIAPLIKNKLEDVPVLVIDEQGNFVIPILSGHYGGANELAEEIAGKMNMTAVITTATDVNGLFAVDVFARKNELTIANKEGIKQISSKILDGESVTLWMDGIYEGELPKRLLLSKEDNESAGRQKASIIISPYHYEEELPHVKLYLIPKAFVIGIGCRKGKSVEEIGEVLEEHLKELKIRKEAVLGIASIDLKKEEEGICRLAEKYGWGFTTFSKEELMQVPGNYTSSGFVKAVVGVDNVCERSAMAACGNGASLILEKQAKNGIAIAIGMRKWSVNFHEI